MSDTLERRIAELEARAQISECVIRYAMSLDRADWELMRATIGPEIFIDFSDWSGMEPRTWPADEWLRFADEALSGFDQRQHLSPNHVITFTDDDHAVCESYMFAQHLLEGAPGGDAFVMRGSYTNLMERTPDGWRIVGMTQHFRWGEGNASIFDAARARVGA
jgi:hypothetical protein